AGAERTVGLELGAVGVVLTLVDAHVECAAAARLVAGLAARLDGIARTCGIDAARVVVEQRRVAARAVAVVGWQLRDAAGDDLTAARACAVWARGIELGAGVITFGVEAVIGVGARDVAGTEHDAAEQRGADQHELEAAPAHGMSAPATSMAPSVSGRGVPSMSV